MTFLGRTRSSYPTDEKTRMAPAMSDIHYFAGCRRPRISTAVSPTATLLTACTRLQKVLSTSKPRVGNANVAPLCGDMADYLDARSLEGCALKAS